MTVSLLYQLVCFVLYIGITNASAPSYALPSFISRSENLPKGSELFTFTVTDADPSPTVSLTATPSDLISVSPTSGGSTFDVSVILERALDRETLSTHTLGFVATDDSNNQVEKTTKLYVLDVNDNHPVFENVPYFWDIPELPCNTSIKYTQVHAVDPDSGVNGTVMYSLLSIDAALDYNNTFGIDETSGEISLKKCLDYVENSYYQFTVIAKDQGTPTSLSTNESLIIRVKDVQNLPPFFTSVPYRASIDEGNPKDTDVLKVTARDGDTGVSNQVNYAIVGGSCNDSFKIDPTEGQISTSQDLDRDSGSIMVAEGVCVLTVEATEIDNVHPQFGNTTSTTDVTITVNDINDNVPSFNSAMYQARIQENAQRNVPIEIMNPHDIVVTDMDQGDFATMNINLQWKDGSSCDNFKVSPTVVRQSGSLIIQVENSSILDFEVTHQLDFFIIATERANASHVATASVTLVLTDENDNTPQFSERSYSFSINEHPNLGESVGTINATDADSGGFKNVTYSLLGGEDKFEIDNQTGVIVTKCEPDRLDRETIIIYYLTVTATDDEGQGRSNSTSVKITLIDINDNTPVFLRDVYQQFVKENDEYNTTPVLTVSAQDNDEHGTNNSQVEYFIQEQQPSWISSNITINKTTGEIYFSHPIDYERLLDKESGRFNFIVYARDFGSPRLTGNATVEISVEDMNDNAPTFNLTSYSATVPENATSTVNQLYSVITVSATDMDGSERNNRFQYFISDGAKNRFGVDPENGNIYVQRNALLDREDDPEYNITIIAIDLGNPPRNGTTEVLITVTDINDESPVFDSSMCNTAEILENASLDTLIATCNATDPDSGYDLLYNITNIHATNEDGNVAEDELVKGFFSIDPDTGLVSVKSELDREVADEIIITIQVKDVNAELNAPQIDTKTLRVTLLDINDNYPVFTMYNYTMDVSENALNPTRLDTIQATDADVNRTITYSIYPGANPTQSFSIDSSTGILYKNGTIDREVNSTIVLFVTATDNGVPTKNSTTTVLIDVIDYNDNSPIFFDNSTHQIRHVYENESIGTVVFVVEAYDIDAGENADIVYKIENGADGHFAIDPVNGTISISAKLDRETQQTYVVRIHARDNPKDPSEQRINQTVLTINILDVNDNAPNFTEARYSIDIVETANIGDVVTTITAMDKDSGVNKDLTYSIGNVTGVSGLFAVQSTTGEIYVNSSLRTHVGSHFIELIAEDGGLPSLDGSTIVNITVTDVNIHPPVITNLPENDTIPVYECFKVGTEIYKFNYSDDDRGENANAYFNITAIDTDNVLDKFEMTVTGALKIKDSLDANEASSYRIQATDRGLPSPLPSVKHTLFINVIDVNNYLPGFTSDAEQFPVKENEPNGTIVGTVTAIDEDKDSVTCYKISDELNSALFEIGRETGTIQTKRPIDREVDGETLKVIVVVTDCTVSDGDSCGNDTNPPVQNHRPNMTVTVQVMDVDDNPPVFLYDEISVGMRRNEEVNFILDIDLKNGGYVKDNDTDKYGRQSWVFANNGTASLSPELNGQVIPGTGSTKCSADGMTNLLCVTGNGTVVNNKFFNEDMSGFILLPVTVEDGGGIDHTILKIYLISDSQVLIMTIFDSKQDVADYKDTLLELYSNITKYTFVYDGLQDHKTATDIDTTRSDLYFHIVDPVTQRILPSDEAQRLIDSFYGLLRDATTHYKVLQILASTAVMEEVDEDPMRTVYILSAVVVLLVLTVAVIVYVSMTLRSRYQRKIKALTVDKIPIVKDESTVVIPGSNQYSKMSNPLLNAKIEPTAEYDNYSLSSNDSIDKNEVGTPRDDTFYDEIEVKEKTMELYMESTHPEDTESPLDAALRMHDMNKASADRDDDAILDDVDDVDCDQVVIQGYMNDAFQMESSEI